MELTQVAEMAGIPLSTLKTFNAGVKTSTVGKNQRYVMVPKKHADQLKASLASGEIAAVQPTLVADNRISAGGSKSYRVRSGDTLSSIASRLGVSSKDLQSWNGIRGAHIKVGQTLSVKNGAQSLAKNDSITYKVRKGDSLSSIAKRHGVNIKDVLRWNDDTDNLKPGDQLTLFVSNNSTPDT
ncbi:Membrane-bound lytic murein transglycosylase D precursor [compost metagenome]